MSTAPNTGKEVYKLPHNIFKLGNLSVSKNQILDGTPLKTDFTGRATILTKIFSKV